MSVQHSVDNVIKKPELVAYEKYIERYGYAAKNVSSLVAFAKKEGIDGVTYSKCKIIMSLMESEETVRKTPKSSDNERDENIGSINSSKDDTLKNKQEKNENKDDEKMIEMKLDELSDIDNNKSKQQQKNMEEENKGNDEDDNSIPNIIKSLR